MLKNKRILIIILIVIMVAILITVGIILIKNNQEQSQNNETSVEKLESDFKNMFSKFEYSTNEEEIISLTYEWEKTEEDKYSINVNFPKINIKTDVVDTINNDIINTFGEKLIDIVNNNKAYIIYNVDYVTFVNDNILSLIIKCTLKEGNNPQRVMIQTYNYDISRDKLVTIEELLQLKQINKNDLQTQIIKEVREKSENSKILEEQGYNIYVRNIRSDEYLIENIENFFLGEEGYLYIVFSYGNKNLTETMDIIIV